MKCFLLYFTCISFPYIFALSCLISLFFVDQESTLFRGISFVYVGAEFLGLLLYLVINRRYKTTLGPGCIFYSIRYIWMIFVNFYIPYNVNNIINSCLRVIIAIFKYLSLIKLMSQYNPEIYNKLFTLYLILCNVIDFGNNVLIVYRDQFSCGIFIGLACCLFIIMENFFLCYKYKFSYMNLLSFQEIEDGKDFKNYDHDRLLDEHY